MEQANGIENRQQLLANPHKGRLFCFRAAPHNRHLKLQNFI